MIGLAANHDSERHESTIAAAARGKRDRSGNLERAWNGQRLMLVTRRLDRGARAGEQHVVEVRIEARFDQQDRRHQASPEVELGISIGRSSTIASP
jgi:hypothetical protein